MRNTWTVILISMLGLASCDDSAEVTLDCAAVCRRLSECGADSQGEACQRDCATTKETMPPAMVADMNACQQRPSCDERQTCQAAVMTACAMGQEDVSSWVTGICNTVLSCEQNTMTMAECRESFAQYEGFLRCLSPSARDGIVACTAGVSCPGPGDIEGCAIGYAPLWEELGGQG